jgi:hypothetical protein
MKHAGVAQLNGKSDAQGVWPMPRGWVVLGAALGAWLIVTALVIFAAQLFGLLAPLF